MLRVDEYNEPYYGWFPTDNKQDLFNDEAYGRITEIGADDLAKFLLMDEDKEIFDLINEYKAKHPDWRTELDFDVDGKFADALRDWLDEALETWEDNSDDISSRNTEDHYYFYDRGFRTYKMDEYSMDRLPDFLYDEIGARFEAGTI